MAKRMMTLEEKLEETIVKDVPYEVPENWINVKLNSIVKFEKGKKPKVLIDNIDEDTIPYVTIKYFQTKEAEQYTFKTETNRICNEEDILIVWDGARAGLIGTGVNGALGSTLCKIKFNNINKKYMYYYFSSKYDLINSNTKGTGIPHVDPNYLDTLVLGMPPLKEQQRIVERIESLFKKLDKAKELIEEARDGFEKRKSAILEKAFRGDLTKEWRREKNINANPKVVSLKEVANFKGGFAFKSTQFVESGIQVIRMGNLYNGVLDLNRNPVYVSENIDANLIDKYSVKQGDILLTLTGTKYKRDYGFAVLIQDNKELLLNQRILSITPKEDIDTSYLYYYLKSELFRDIFFSQETGGVNQGNVSGKFVESINISIVSIEEQNEIVRILDKLLKDESKIEELTALEEQIELIKKSILAKAFRGELGTNCEEDESALELLKEILNT